MKLLVFVLVVTFAWVQARVGEVCHTETECDAGECCQIMSLFQVVSRRQIDMVDPNAPRAGTCQLYKTENQTCSSFEKINGYCGCGPGLQCHSYEVKIADVQVVQPPLFHH
nr:hypothetical protein BaRGS_021008 [Batillaria attramentaria]KAG5687997.1 hypothetical protein BaRGS_022938 [Batillaria attramentaria]